MARADYLSTRHCGLGPAEGHCTILYIILYLFVVIGTHHVIIILSAYNYIYVVSVITVYIMWRTFFRFAFRAAGAVRSDRQYTMIIIRTNRRWREEGFRSTRITILCLYDIIYIYVCVCVYNIILLCGRIRRRRFAYAESERRRREDVNGRSR